MNGLILNDAGYLGFEDVKFPVEVEVCYTFQDKIAMVSGEQLQRITQGCGHFNVKCKYAFYIGEELEIVS